MRADAVREARELPRWLWLWFPPLLVVAMLTVSLVDSETFAAWFKTKEGPIEWATVLVLLPAIAAGIHVWRRRALLPEPWLGWWMGLVGLGAFYYAGEEISWGQQIWHWETPDFLARINDQQETNFHNLEGFGIFEEIPRNALEQWILWGGIIFPVLAWKRGWTYGLERWQAWFVPTLCCLPTAVLAIVIRLPDRLDRLTGKQLAWLRGVRVSEPQEYYFALFLMMYLLSVAVRLRRRDAESRPAGSGPP